MKTDHLEDLFHRLGFCCGCSELKRYLGNSGLVFIASRNIISFIYNTAARANTHIHIHTAQNTVIYTHLKGEEQRHKRKSVRTKIWGANQETLANPGRQNRFLVMTPCRETRISTCLYLLSRMYSIVPQGNYYCLKDQPYTHDQCYMLYACAIYCKPPCIDILQPQNVTGVAFTHLGSLKMILLVYVALLQWCC